MDARRVQSLSYSVLEQIIASSVQGILLVEAVGPSYRIRYANAAYEELSGYPAADLLGHPWSRHFNNQAHGEELAELVVIFQREGRTYEEARLLADEIAQDKELWLNTLVEKELGISPEETTNPKKDAVVMGTSFIIAALVPIIPYLFLRG